MNILLTGHSGYIGSNLLPKIIKNHNILLLQNTKKQGIALTDVAKQKIDICIHLAGNYKSNSKKILYKSNFNLTKKLLRELGGTNCRKIIFTSSIAAEKSINTYYGYLKSQCEKILNNSKILATILRLGPVYDKKTKGIFSNFLKFNKLLIMPSGVKVQPTKLDNIIAVILHELEIVQNKKTRVVNLYEPAQDYDKFLSRIYNTKEYICLRLNRSMIKLLANIVPVYNIRQSLKRIL